MGRNAAGNRGISLKKNDYLIGAAITNSHAMREEERRICAEQKGLTDELNALIAAYKQAEEALTQKRQDVRDKTADVEAVNAAEKALDQAEKAFKALDEKLGVSQQLILTVTENGFGKRTDVDAYRLTSRGAQGVINLKATPKVGKTTEILLVDETSEMMAISQFGKIIRFDTKQVRAAGRATQGVRLLNLEDGDKVAAAVIIPPEEVAIEEEQPPLL
jgi:DNA gyrase subunit A